MDGWMDGWTDGWMDGWMEGVIIRIVVIILFALRLPSIPPFAHKISTDSPRQ